MSESATATETVLSSPVAELPRSDEREHLTIIEPRPGWRALNIREMWAYRELLFFLTWRDVKIRYKQTLLGAAWAIVQPLMYMVVFFVVFFRIAQAPSEGIPYPLFAFSGLALWTFFSTAITQAGNSVIGSEALITKVYFPRLAIPFAAVGAALFDFAITFIVLVVMILGYVFFTDAGGAIVLTWQLLLVPGLVLLTLLAALGVGTFLAALNVSYRDFKHTIPFLVQLWLFATPAIYMGVEHERIQRPLPAAAQVTAPAAQAVGGRPHSKPGHAPAAAHPDRAAGPAEGAVPDWVQQALKFNPMTGLVRSFRAAMLGQPMPWTHLTYSILIVVAVFLGGCLYFHRVEDAFADII